MGHRAYAAVFFGLCWTQGAGVEVAEPGEDALVERYARRLGLDPKPPQRYGDGVLVSEVKNPIDAQLKRKLVGYGPDHEAWEARARRRPTRSSASASRRARASCRSS